MVEHLSIAEVQEARRRLIGVIKRTPLEESRNIGALLGRQVYFKMENLQRTGSFKIRGPTIKFPGPAPLTCLHKNGG